MIYEDYNIINEKEVFTVAGDTGEKGDKGLKGLTGATGNKGLPGLVGTTVCSGYGVCTTEASEATKEVTLNNFDLTKQTMFVVLFRHKVDRHSSLNVNNTGAKYIMRGGTKLERNVICDGALVTFVYDKNKDAYVILAIDKEKMYSLDVTADASYYTYYNSTNPTTVNTTWKCIGGNSIYALQRYWMKTPVLALEGSYKAKLIVNFPFYLPSKHKPNIYVTSYEIYNTTSYSNNEYLTTTVTELDYKSATITISRSRDNSYNFSFYLSIMVEN